MWLRYNQGKNDYHFYQYQVGQWDSSLWHLVWFRCSTHIVLLHATLFHYFNLNNPSFIWILYTTITSRCVLITQCDYQCSNKQQSIPILFVWYLCSSWLFLTPSFGVIKMLPWLIVYTPLCRFPTCDPLFLITASVSSHHGNFDYYWDIHVHGLYF